MAETLKAVGPTALTTSAATIYTVPGATTFVLRTIHVVNLTGSEINFTLSIGADAAGTRIEYQRAIPAREEFSWGGFIVVAASTAIQAYASAATSANILLAGTEVT